LTTYPPTILPLDLTDLTKIPDQAAKAQSLYGVIDIVINNAGISHRGGALHTSTQVDIQIMTVNYFGQIALTKGKHLPYTNRSLIFIGRSTWLGTYPIPPRTLVSRARLNTNLPSLCLLYYKL